MVPIDLVYKNLTKSKSGMYYKGHIFLLIILIYLTNACPKFQDYDPNVAFDAFDRQCVCPSDLPYSTG